MVRKFAVINNNIVTSLIDIEDGDVGQLFLQNDMVIDIEDTVPQPQLGWVLSGNKMVPNEPVSIEEILRGRIKLARQFGVALVQEETDRIGALNLLNGKTENEIVQIMTLLDPIKKLLEGGALVTARSSMSLIRDSFDAPIKAEMDRAIEKITTYLGY